MDTNKFITHAVGKCCDCGKSDTLDSMVRKDNTKGNYHCKDCETTDYMNKETMKSGDTITKNKSKVLAWALGCIFILCLIDVSFAGTTINDDIIAYYRFDGNLSDATGGNGGTGYNSPILNTTNAKLGSGCLYLKSASNMYLNLSNALQFQNEKGFTVNLWFNITTGSGDFAFMSCMYKSSAPRSGFFYEYWFTNNRFGVNSIHNGNALTSYFDNSTLKNKKWHMITMIHNSTTPTAISWYIDGNLVTEVADTTAGNMTFRDIYPYCCIGIDCDGKSTSISNPYQGYMDELGYWGKSLNSTQVKQLYNSGAGLVPSFGGGAGGGTLTSVTIVNPSNNTNINASKLIYYNVTGSLPITCKLYQNSTYRDYSNIPNLQNQSFTFTSAWFTQGYNIVNVTCNTTTTFKSSKIYLFVDTNNPTITYANYKNYSTGARGVLNNSKLTEFYFNISVSDTNLYLYNRSIYNSSKKLVNFSTHKQSSGTSYIDNLFYNASLLRDGVYKVNVTVCDAHTGELISTLPTEPIAGGIKISGIDITTSSASFISINAVQIKDRVTFELILNKAETEIIMKVKAKDSIVPYNSQYQGHFIIDGVYWVDFVNPDFKVVSTRRLSNLEYEISLKSLTGKSSIKFDSVGLINCIKTQYTLNLYNNPSVSFNKATPNDLPILYFKNTTINYTVSDPSGIKKAFIIRYTNSSLGSIFVNHINGTTTSSYVTSNYSRLGGSTYEYDIQADNIQPATYNINRVTMYTTSHGKYNLTNNNEYLKSRIFNISIKKYSALEIYANSTQPFEIYYCNSSYVSGNIINSNSCGLMATIPGFTPFNHSHSINSRHIVVPFPINQTSQKFNLVKVTPTSFFVVRGIASVFYINKVTRPDTTRLSINNGVTWASLPISVDFHVHQYNGTEKFSYFIEACDNAGNCINSTRRIDQLNTTRLSIISPQIIRPTNTSYYKNVTSGIARINITYLKAYNLNFEFANDYNISLWRNLTVSVSNITDNGNKTSYLWLSNVSVGQYRIRVYAKDFYNSTSFAYSESFTVATSTTTTTTAPAVDLTGLETTANALNSILMFFLWFALLCASYILKGQRGGTIQLLNTIQGLVSIPVGMMFVRTSPMIAILIIFAGCGIMAGRWIYDN